MMTSYATKKDKIKFDRKPVLSMTLQRISESEDS